MAAFKTNYISTAELARFLGISRVAVIKRIQKGAIPAVKIGRAYAIPEAVVSEYFPKYKTRLAEAPGHVSVLEAARILGVSRFAISKRIERGQLEARRVGRRYVISKETMGALQQRLTKDIVTDKEFLSIPEYARLLQVSRVAIYKKVKKGILKARKIGRHYVIDVKGSASVGPDAGQSGVTGEGYWSVIETAEYLGISRVAVFKKVTRGMLKAIKIGRSYAILPGEVMRHAAQQRTKKHDKQQPEQGES